MCLVKKRDMIGNLEVIEISEGGGAFLGTTDHGVTVHAGYWAPEQLIELLHKQNKHRSRQGGKI